MDGGKATTLKLLKEMSPRALESRLEDFGLEFSKKYPSEVLAKILFIVMKAKRKQNPRRGPRSEAQIAAARRLGALSRQRALQRRAAEAGYEEEELPTTAFNHHDDETLFADLFGNGVRRYAYM